MKCDQNEVSWKQVVQKYCRFLFRLQIRKTMWDSMDGFKWKLVVLLMTISLIQCQGVTWTDFPQLRMGQQTVYDTVYIPVNTNSQVDITYKTAFASAVTTAHQGVVISGFENYLQFEIIMNVTIVSCDQNKVKINIWIGPMTNIKQMKVNYFVMQTTVGTLHQYIQVKVGNYRTLDLDDANGLRKQVFQNQTTTFSNVFSLCSAIHGVEYYNTDGTVNQINVDTQFVPLAQKIKQTVTVGQKGRLNYISITTILIDAAFYPNPNPYLKLGYTFQSTIIGSTGLQILKAMSDGGLFSSTDNSIFFGMRGFNFTMQNTRLFLLSVATRANFLENLVTNNFMKYTEISVLVLVQRVCTTASQFYYVEGFKCLPSACTDLYKNTASSLCQNCASVCNGCNSFVGDCKTCKPGNNRVINTTVPSPVTCLCDYHNGYVQVNKQDVCQLCSTYLPGCLKCSTPLSCDDCGDTNLYERIQYDGTNWKCQCKNGKHLVTGKCLSYPGCLRANQYVTGQFCQECDTANNFQKDLTNNSSCKCMLAYFPHPKNSSKCVDICPDGLTPDSPPNAKQTQKICDDNNTINGDGCSQSCKQQFGFVCNVKNRGQISICAEKQQINIQYLYSQKNLISNQATIVFALLPPQNFLNQTTFQNSVTTNVPGSRKIKFDPKNSLILITVDYTQTLQEKQYDFTFSFLGLSIFSNDINKKAQLYGRNAKLEIGKAHPQVNVITYVALAVAAFALVLALVAAFLGEKMMGIELILPIQAACFTLVTFPKNILSPISALWSLKFSNGYNSLDRFDLTTNYMLDSRVTLLQYSGQFLLNYNIMFSLLGLVILIIGMIAIRIAWLQRQQGKLEQLLKKLEQEQKQNKQEDSKKKKSKKEKVKLQSRDQKQKDSEQEQKFSQKQTQEQNTKQEQTNVEIVNQELQDVRENIRNWRNFMYMIFDRFFTILIVTAMMVIIFCFYVQLSNLSYNNEVFSNSLNAGFFFITYATIVTGLYAIIYDYKTDKLITFTCNKGKYAMFYIALYLTFIIILGAMYQSDIAIYVIAAFPILALILIPYQVPYGIRVIDFQIIIAFICQFPFLATVAISVILNLQKSNINEQTSTIFAYVIIGTIGLSIILTIARMIKVIDCKKVSCVEFTDRKKDNKNDKNKKKNKIMVLDDLDLPKNNWDQYSQDSVRSILKQRKYDNQNQQFNIEKQNKEAYDAISKKSEPKALQKDKEKVQQEQDDQQIDELEKIKLKLRKDLKQKKMIGKIK